MELNNFFSFILPIRDGWKKQIHEGFKPKLISYCNGSTGAQGTVYSLSSGEILLKFLGHPGLVDDFESDQMIIFTDTKPNRVYIATKISFLIELNDCYEENTYRLNETIFDAFHNVIEQNDLLKNTSSWIVNKGNVYKGQCHTFQYPNPLQADAFEDVLMFAINPNISYEVFFHDPNYYLIVPNPMVFPRIWLEYKVSN